MNLSDVKTLEDLKRFKHEVETQVFIPLKKELMNASTSDHKKSIGIKLNEEHRHYEGLFAKALENINAENVRTLNKWFDVTSIRKPLASLHPLTLVANRFRTWFIANGYFEVTGPEIETDDYNFTKLNMGPGHPARAMQDSFYINDNRLLRTHNTGFTARELAKNANRSFGQFAIGKVYRNDENDQTHSFQFTQLDFVFVGKVTLGNLIWTLRELLSYVFEVSKPLELRLRPSYFPFTEPSFEVDISLKGKWVEVLGAGIVHKNVMQMAHYTNDMNGFAAGIGLERICMIKYGITDIRDFYTNDLRFLTQFAGSKN